MAKSKSSKEWLKQHRQDHYVKLARQQGFRSRAVFKLQQIDEKYQLTKECLRIIELGSAPGGWSQWLSQNTTEAARIIAVDILPTDPYAKVEFLQGDITEPEVFEQLLKLLEGIPVDLVVSDMSVNHSGIKTVDVAKNMYLSELCLGLAQQVLKPQGHLLMKVFQGAGIDDILHTCKRDFEKVHSIKPDASKNTSRELYLLARHKKDPAIPSVET